MPAVPPPTQHGWATEDNILEPVWSDGPILPKQLIDILAQDGEEPSPDESSDEAEEEVEVDFSSDEESDSD